MATTKWVVDPMHSEVQFKVKHLVISTVTGTFRNFDGGATTEHDDFDGAEVHFSLDVNSVDTNQEMRDTHLKSADFFEAETYPKIAFKSTSFKKVDDDEYVLTGDLTMKGVTKPVTLKAEYGGTAKDNYGNKKLGFEVTGKINRKEFGLTYNALTETGGLALGEDIKLIANIQLAQAA
ncbi:YceI family protein [Spirosoma endophyticum]|uniref:Polyisoprenoid-binding protein YceI n=1 Tax=Spirosoma endophyticum TaxID=662367 RepID=A0A1I1LBT0_9BACT|nr:YceI family protein [Spirosoma endophyticum]SFC66990.1 Polyisoprenoid-binding protein YceI [Spirosoma endophyticum]